MPTIGFLHTADVHVTTFQALVTELAPGWAERHVVDASLLSDAQAAGVTPEIADRVRGRLAEVAAGGADVIVCTCSTIGAVAEEAGSAGRPDSVSVPVLRVDRPMAEAAVAAGRRIAVVATVRSTVEPTMALLRDSAARAGADVTLVAAPCLSAWRHFEVGDGESYYEEVADHVRGIVDDVDVVVLAQASLSGAADRLAGLPVLTSPRAAVSAAVARLAGN